jgi:hypothetical protein
MIEPINDTSARKADTMASTTAPQTPAPTVEAFDAKEVTRMIARLKHEVGGLVQDANRARPFYAPTKAEAATKRDAALAVLAQAAEKIDTIKKDNS